MYLLGLLEEKGISRSDKGLSGDVDALIDGGRGDSKTSLGTKLKEKLHIGKH
jgi:hypothetical protein